MKTIQEITLKYYNRIGYELEIDEEQDKWLLYQFTAMYKELCQQREDELAECNYMDNWR